MPAAAKPTPRLMPSKGAGQAGDEFSVTNQLAHGVTDKEVNGSTEVTVTNGNTGCTADFTWTGYQL